MSDLKVDDFMETTGTVSTWIPETKFPVEKRGNVDRDAGLDDSSNAWKRLDTTKTKVGSNYLKNLIPAASMDEEEILTRQNAIMSIDVVETERIVTNCVEYVDTALWILSKTDESLTQWPAKMLYFQYFKSLNQYPLALMFNVVMRCLITPVMAIISPLLALVIPFFVLRYKWNLPITISVYIRLMKNIFTRYVHENNVSYLSIIMWLGIMATAIGQTIQTAVQLFKSYWVIITRVSHVHKLLTLTRTMSDYPMGLPGLKRMIEEPKYIREAMMKLAEMDAHLCIRKHVDENFLVKASLSNEKTVLSEMRHPCLDKNQISNPIVIQNKGIVVTGANASGKTTYVRAMLCASIMAQSIGFVCAKSAKIRLYDVIQSHMRISDRLDNEGDGESLFQAELGLCTHVINEAINKKRQILFMDEPFHSVAPDIGDAISQAFLHRFAELGTDVVVTSHYPGVAGLGGEHSDKFTVVGFSAERDSLTTRIVFPYKVSRGISAENIVLDLMDNADSRVVSMAKEILSSKLGNTDVDSEPKEEDPDDESDGGDVNDV